MMELSIIIPVYNSEKYIQDCLNSICKQIKNEVELILVNDGSKDDSLKICKYFSKKYKNIKIINEKKNRGVSYSRNVGIKNSGGKYILFCDSDDQLINHSINKILYNIKKYSNTEIFVLRNKIISQNSVDKNQFTSAYSNKKKSILNNIKNFKKFRATCWNFIIQKRFLLFKKIKFKNIEVFEDQVFISNLLCNTKSYKIINEPIYLHRAIEPNSLSNKTGYTIVNSCAKILYEITNILLNRENLLNEKKVSFLKSRLKYASDRFFIHILTCDSSEIKKISKYLSKNYFILSKFPKLNTYNFIRIIKERKNIEKNLFKYQRKKISFIKNIVMKIEKNKLILFCAGSYSKVILKSLYKLGVKVHAIIDNNRHYFGKRFNNTKIKNPLYLKKNFRQLSDYNFLVCNKNFLAFSKIKIQLGKIGFNKKKIIHVGI